MNEKIKGRVKWFDRKKGWGFIVTEDKKSYFVHQSNIIMDGFRTLHEDDIVEFEIGTTDDGRVQAMNVKPIVTFQMVREALEKEDLHIKPFTAELGGTKRYLVVDSSDVVQSSDRGMDFSQLAEYAGLSA